MALHLSDRQVRLSFLKLNIGDVALKTTMKYTSWYFDNYKNDSP